MTTNQSNDGNHANGVTERTAPAAAPDEATAKSESPENAPESAGAAKAASKEDRFQEGWSQLPQREPQSNISRPGVKSVTGGAGAAKVGLSGSTGNARTTADLAAKAARKEAAMVKSVGIDGPTRSIARPELIKDMPDLSELRHPLPTAAPAPASDLPMAHIPGPAAKPMSPSVPVAAAAAPSGEPLRATVQLRHIDPWSTLKVTLVISIAMFFVWMLAVGLLYIVLSGMGVWDRLNTSFTDIVSDSSSSGALIDAGSVFGYAAVIGIISVVLLTALSTVGVFIYNQCTDLVGGIQLTLADPD